MRLIQLTDAHLHADIHARSRSGVPWRQFTAVIEAVAAEQPDIVVVSGDISQDESEGSYARAVEALNELRCPWFWLPGNHDDVELMADAHPLLNEVDIDIGRIVLLNTQVPGKPHGKLGSDRLEALANTLAADERPVFVVMHHPPVDVGAAWMDAIGLEDREAFWEVVGAFAHVNMVLFGHAHQAFATTYPTAAGTVEVYGCPATSDQFMPGAPTFSVDQASRPGYRVIDIQAGEWLTWIERVQP